MPPDDTGAKERLIRNAVLNFAVRAYKAGNQSADIMSKAAEFFELDDIRNAKKLLWSEAGQSTRPTNRDKPTDHIFDIIKALKYCDDNKVNLPCFVIYEPDEVPVIAGEISATLTRKVNELSAKFDSFVRSASQSQPAASSVPLQTATVSTYAVVLKNPPKGLDDPVSRKDYLDKVCGSNCGNIVELKTRKTDWKVVLNDQEAAKSVAQAIAKSDSSIKAKVSSPAFFGIIRHVPTSVSEEDLCGLVNNCAEASQIGKTRSFRLKFVTKHHLASAVKSPLIIGYERIPVEDFHFLPRRCYKCQAYGHIAKDCSNKARCSNCGGGHTNSKDTPCQNQMKCALCGSDKHPCYSFSCPEAKKALSKR